MKYIRTKDGKIFEIVDYEQLDENTKKNVRQPRYVGLEDYLNEKIFVKIYKNMPNPISQYQSIKMFDILKQANTIEELCDEFVFHVENQGHWGINNYKRALEIAKSYNEDKNKFICYAAIWTKWGLKYVAKMNKKGELELL